MWPSSLDTWLTRARMAVLSARRLTGLGHRRRAPYRLCLEVLEDRTTPVVFTVTNLNDTGAGSLRDAVQAANVTGEHDDIVFQPGLTGTITLTTGQLPLTRPVTITGPGSGRLTISGNNASRVFHVNNGSAAVQNFAISGLTVTGGVESGGTSSQEGGGIEVQSEDVTLTDVVVTGNRTVRGGGIDVGQNGRLTLINCVVHNNTSTIPNAATEVGGGGLFLDTNTVALIRNSTFSANMTGGESRGGAGVYAVASAFLTVESSTFTGNQTTASGGAIYVAGTAIVRNSTLSGNTAGAGGGIFANEGGTLTVENSTISGNSAVNNGGGLQQFGATSTLRNSTVAFNIADSNNAGGGRSGGGIVTVAGAGTLGNLTLQSTIVAQNRRGPLGQFDDIVSNTVPTTGTNNLIGVGTGLVGITNGPGSNQVGTAIALNPQLGPLASNGGPTQTRALLAGSPALDRGFNFSGQATDQRGGRFARTFGSGTDIGAFEVQPDPPVSTPRVEIRLQRVRGRTRVEVLVNGVRRRRFFPFGAFTGRVQVQKVDLNADGLLDVRTRATINGYKRTRTFLT